MNARSFVQKVAAVALALACAVLVAPGCEQIAGFPDRAERDHLASCGEGVCTCTDGFGDCNDDLDDGCEIPLGSAEDHCGTCGRSCLGGGCLNATCGFVVMHAMGELAGPALYAGRLFVMDLETGDLLASPLAGDPAFEVIQPGAKPAHYVGNFGVGPDGVYVISSPSGPTIRLQRVDAQGAITEPFGTLPWNLHAELAVAPTTDAVFYQEGTNVYRIDRVTQDIAPVTKDAKVFSLKARGDDVFFSEGDAIFIVRPGAGAAKEALFANLDETICVVYPLASGYAVKRCTAGGIKRWDDAGNVIGAMADADVMALQSGVTDVVEHDGMMYLLYDDQNQVLAWNGTTPPPSIVTGSQPFGFGTFRIVHDDGVLYWGAKTGVVRIVL